MRTTFAALQAVGFLSRLCVAMLPGLAMDASAAEVPLSLRLAMPERVQLLEGQRADLVVELRGAERADRFRAMIDGDDVTAAFRGPIAQDLDCDTAPDAVFRADLYEFRQPGNSVLRVEAAVNGQLLRDERIIEVRPFSPGNPPGNVVLFIGDGMGNTYRDAARIVARSVPARDGRPGLREGRFESWLEMDQLPISGQVINHSLDRLAPDSAATATALATANKTADGYLATWPDGTDCRWKQGLANSLSSITDNPRIESLMEYLKRRHGYRVGNISTAFLTDATPAAQGAHVATRDAQFEIARQYLENPVLGGRPVFDVLLGGGKENFDADVRSDGRNLLEEFRRAGYTFVSDAGALRDARPKNGLLLGLFRAAPRAAAARSGLKSTANGNLDTAYDKLHALGRAGARPGSEPAADLSSWPNQPFLDEMTRKALEILGSDPSRPFILQVEGALIDKQSHSGHATGAIWEVIDLDRAVGVARQWAGRHPEQPTLIIVTADHDQSMVLTGTVSISDADLTDRTPVAKLAGTAVFKDSAANLRASLALPALPQNLREEIRSRSVEGFPDYQDADGDGFPDNRESDGKGRRRLAVGYRTGDHTANSVPLTAGGAGAALFAGYMDQTEVPLRIARAIGVEGQALSKLGREIERERDGRVVAAPGSVRNVEVYRDARRFGGWPANHGIWVWGNEILVGFEAGWLDLSAPGHAIDRNRPAEHLLARSRDGGLSWTIEKPQSLLPPPDIRMAGIATEEGGKAVTDCHGAVDFAAPGFALTARMASKDDGPSHFYYSQNKGKSWNGPYRLPNFGFRGIAARTDYLVLGKHELMLFLTAAKSNGKEGRVIAVRTNDGGKSWHLVAPVGDEPPEHDYEIMPSTVRTRSGALVMVTRSRRWNTVYRSSDGGKTWKLLGRPFRNGGNPVSLVCLRDGRLAAVYGYRLAPYGLRARMSNDDGATWSEEIVLRADGGNWDLGYPRTVQRADGKLVTVYYFNDSPQGERYIAATIWDADAALK